jgi:hypothetical protein
MARGWHGRQGRDRPARHVEGDLSNLRLRYMFIGWDPVKDSWSQVNSGKVSPRPPQPAWR